MKPLKAPELAVDAYIAPLASLARRAAPGEVPAMLDAASREGFLLELAQRRSRRQRRSMLLAAAAIALFAVTVAVARWQSQPLTYAVSGGALIDRAGTITAPAESNGADVRFSDGTALDVSPASRLRVTARSQRGAHIALQDGTLRAHVAHRPGAEWVLQAGPFSVTVHGTVFDLSWRQASEVLVVALHEGQVSVMGGPALEPIALTPGQRLEASVRTGELRIESLARIADTSSATPPPSASAAPSVAPAPTNSQTGPEPTSALAHSEHDAHADTRAPQASSLSWSQRVAAGEFSSVLTEANTVGLDQVLAHRPLDQLVALADAARYVGRADVARRAMNAERTRFASSEAARTAAFMLGRVSDDVDHAPASALVWYERYLQEAPRGRFAPEAMGRRMVALEHAGRHSDARTAAQDYLARYATGPYNGPATAILARP